MVRVLDILAIFNQSCRPCVDTLQSNCIGSDELQGTDVLYSNVMSSDTHEKFSNMDILKRNMSLREMYDHVGGHIPRMDEWMSNPKHKRKVAQAEILKFSLQKTLVTSKPKQIASNKSSGQIPVEMP